MKHLCFKIVVITLLAVALIFAFDLSISKMNKLEDDISCVNNQLVKLHEITEELIVTKNDLKETLKDAKY